MLSEGYVEYVSHGKCIVMGDEGLVRKTIHQCQWPKHIKPVAMVVNEKIKREQIKINGYLGNFTITIEKDNDNETPEWNKETKYDLVLDLFTPPLIGIETKPLGYFWQTRKSADIEEMVANLGEWVGIFEKPKYFSYNPGICAHGNEKKRGCQSCLEVCSADAISSKGDRVEIDPYLCQGCGDCATACPTGAMNYLWPAREEVMETLVQGLRETTGKKVLFHSKAQTCALSQSDNELTIEVESVASVGPEIWLVAIACGASGVHLRKENLTPLSVQNIERHMTWVNTLLDQLDYGSQLVQWHDEYDDRQTKTVHSHHVMPAEFAPLNDKRAVLTLALDHLCKNASNGKAEFSLPSGAPLGDVRIDATRCTLCLACVGICPGKALGSGYQSPRLTFLELNCSQCGLCAQICPEEAIELMPRVVKDRDRIREIQLKYEDEPFHCIQCGRDFATKTMIESIKAKLIDHDLFSGQQQSRWLMMCEHCRVQEMFKDE